MSLINIHPFTLKKNIVSGVTICLTPPSPLCQVMSAFDRPLLPPFVSQCQHFPNRPPSHFGGWHHLWTAPNCIPTQCNFTTMYIRLVCHDRNLYLGGTTYFPGAAKPPDLWTNDAISHSFRNNHILNLCHIVYFNTICFIFHRLGLAAVWTQLRKINLNELNSIN